MRKGDSAETIRGIIPYETGKHYGRYLAGYEQRYGLVPMTEEAARNHAESMSDIRDGDTEKHFIRGFLDGYALEDRQAQANGG